MRVKEMEGKRCQRPRLGKPHNRSELIPLALHVIQLQQKEKLSVLNPHTVEETFQIIISLKMIKIKIQNQILFEQHENRLGHRGDEFDHLLSQA